MTTVSDIVQATLSGQIHIDALVDSGPGWNWLTPARNTLSYTFTVSGGNPADVGTWIAAAPVALSASQQAAAVQVLGRMTELTGIQFVATTDPSAADIHFGATDVFGAATAGFASSKWSYSFDGSNTVTSYTADSWIYLDNKEFASSNANLQPGTSGYQVLLHEVGHAMGLKHPFEGPVRLVGADDTTDYTVMSYNHFGTTYRSDYAPFDIAALAWLYGGDGLGGTRGLGTANRYLVGTPGTDTLVAGAGNDWLEGGTGTDSMDGGAGSDSAVYPGTRGQYNVVAGADGSFVVTGPQGVDTLLRIEFLRFADQTVSLADPLGNNPPIGSITLVGNVVEGGQITAQNSVLDLDGMGAFTYRWETSRDGVDWATVAGATGDVFTILQGQVGQRLRAVISYVDGKGKNEQFASTPTGVIANINDPPTGQVTLVGLARQGQPLSIQQTLNDPDGLGPLAYTWQSSADGAQWTPIAGATAATFTPSQAQVNQLIRVVTSYVDRQGTRETVTSNVSPRITNVNDEPQGTLTVRGTPAQGLPLTAQVDLTDADGLGTLSYQWQVSSGFLSWADIEGATSASFTPLKAQIGRSIRVNVTYTDGQGTTETAGSRPTDIVADINVPPVGTVSVSGTPQQAQTLTGTVALSDDDDLGPLTYEWQSSADGSTWRAEPGTNALTLQPTADVAGRQLRLVVKYRDGGGTDESVPSASVGVIGGVFNGTAAADTINGTAGPDAISAGAGNDRILASAGDDTINGGDGLDTVVFAGSSGSVRLTRAADGTLTATAGNETDRLTRVERVTFTDRSLAFDLDGNAGAVARLIGAVFGRALLSNPEYTGTGLSLLDGGTTLAALTQLALNVKLGTSFTPTTLVTTLFQNVVGTPPTAADLSFWTGTLSSGQYTNVTLTQLAADTVLNAEQIGLVGLAASGLVYAPQ